jgi:GntR family transcriptional regulator, transcriptional repressor for pyruvate dehydrogenase complex
MTELKPITQQRVYNTIVDQIRILIEDGTWGPGQKIPSERELAEKLSVGRSSVREALRILEAMRYIVIIQGDGVFVNDRAKVSSGFNKLLDIVQDDDYLVDLMEARELVESQIAFLAAESATQEDIQKLEEIVDRQAYQVEKGGDGSQENIEFHIFLSETTGNLVLTELQQSFLSFAHEVISKQFKIPGRIDESVEQHRNLIQAIKERNPAAAHRLMLAHLRSRYISPE